METLFSAGEEIGLGSGEWGVGSGEWGVDAIPYSPLPTPHSPHFALMGYSRNKMNSVMNSVRATAEVLATQ